MQLLAIEVDVIFMSSTEEDEKSWGDRQSYNAIINTYQICIGDCLFQFISFSVRPLYLRRPERAFYIYVTANYDGFEGRTILHYVMPKA